MTAVPPLTIEEAARLLEAGQLVAFPTETVYGLGADAENPDAVASIYRAKGRPSDHPVIVHVAPGADISYWAGEIPAAAKTLMAAFWPGPLTLIFKKADHIPDTVTGGQDTIGLRCPSHPVAQALLKAFKQGKGGIGAPSANKFGRVSPTTAAHVREEFAGEGLAVLDGGQSDVGIESTIVDMTRIASLGPVLLRPGHISADDIAAVLGQAPAVPDQAAPRASGTLASHYAPRTPVVLVSSGELEDICARIAQTGRKLALIAQVQPQGLFAATRLMPSEPAGYAHDLYSALRDMDHTGADVIVVQQPGQGAPWQGVNDRLKRAAHDAAGLLATWLD